MISSNFMDLDVEYLNPVGDFLGLGTQNLLKIDFRTIFAKRGTKGKKIFYQK